MGQFGALHWLILLAIGGFIYYKISSNSSSPAGQSSSESEEERSRQVNKKFDELDRAEMEKMSVAKIAELIGGTERSVIAKLSRYKLKSKDFDGTLSFEERSQKKEIEKNIGILSPQIICPHCQTKGQVHKKIGVERRENTTDTTNLTAAILSGTKTTVRKVTQLHCTNCETTWDI